MSLILDDFYSAIRLTSLPCPLRWITTWKESMVCKAIYGAPQSSNWQTLDFDKNFCETTRRNANGQDSLHKGFVALSELDQNAIVVEMDEGFRWAQDLDWRDVEMGRILK
ncbi:Protein of unknown function [Pyronema omphalodes CBS 100304]|uniref:Uncharacterized protein n=1 Tax=Pyronema omphalodes (strain CBS 100304) TaxID=1076935 RepID=U4KZP0_PYROM|nr:Protein of unknown function [Pyronema omphalodes CBS 100304]